MHGQQPSFPILASARPTRTTRAMKRTCRQWRPVATSNVPVANGGLSPPKASPFTKPFTQAFTQAGRGVKTVHTVRTPTLIGDRLGKNGEPSGTDTSPFSRRSRVPTLHRFPADPGYRHFTVFQQIPGTGTSPFFDQVPGTGTSPFFAQVLQSTRGLCRARMPC